jgi:hypothetical protein
MVGYKILTYHDILNILIIFSYLASLPPQLEERLAQSDCAVRPE